MKKILKYFMAAVMLCSFAACNKDDNKTNGNPVRPETYDMTGFAKGADVSWLTEQEAKGKKFFDANGNETECLQLLRSLGVNAIRLRVWVNPENYYCSKQDVIVKAWRAHNLGFRLMIDFHYSDTWADPGSQTPPAAWASYNLDEMKQAVADHTKDVLQALKDKNIDVEWVQVGNETRTGMLKPLGATSSSSYTNFAALVTAGYDAVKSVYSNAKVIVHLDQGEVLGRFTAMFDGLKAANAKWDVIGMSLYQPNDVNDMMSWEDKANNCLNNIKQLVSKYNKEVMICEIGCNWNADYGEQFISKVMNGCKKINGCLGVFYWEPQCYGGWSGYAKGAFDDSGKPTAIMNAFAR